MLDLIRKIILATDLSHHLRILKNIRRMATGVYFCVCVCVYVCVCLYMGVYFYTRDLLVLHALLCIDRCVFAC